MALRNIVSRNREFIDTVLDAGGEHLIRKAGTNQGAVDEAYAALREMDIEVKRVYVDAYTGQIKETEQFGQNKLKFNAVYDDRENMDQIMDENAIPANEGFNF